MATILCIDDDPVCRRMLSLIVEATGHSAEAAGSVDEAMARVRNRVPAMVLLDIEMKPRDGVECLRLIRSHAASGALPVVLITAYPTRDLVLRVARLGVRGIVLKGPSMAEALSQKILAVLAGKPAGEEREQPAPVSGNGAAQLSVGTSVPVGAGGVRMRTPASHRVSPPPPVADESEHSAPDADSLPYNADEGPLTIEQAMERLRELKPVISRSELTDRITEHADSLQAMSPSARQVISMTGSAGASVESIASTIKQDQALSVRVLKLANSSLYSRGTRVDSVSKAVSRVGLGAIRSAVLTMGVMDQFAGVELVGRATADQFWEHSIATGLIASRLASLTLKGADAPDQMFTAGLLHDVGRMLYAGILGEMYEGVVETAHDLQLPIEAVESRMLLINHADLTDKLLRQWKFAMELINPIALHHLGVDNIRRMAARMTSEVCTLALANRLSHALLLGSSGNDVLYPIADFVRHLAIEPASLAAICGSAVEDTLDLKLNMLSHSTDAGASALDRFRQHPSASLRPLVIAGAPELDATSLLLRRTHGELGPGEKPDIAVVSVHNPSERMRLEKVLEESERRHGVERLPTLVVGPTRACMFPESQLRGRSSTGAIIPMRIERLLDAMAGLASGQSQGADAGARAA